MNKRAKRNLTIIGSIIIAIVLMTSAYILYLGSLNNRMIDVTIEVDKAIYSINESVTFTLTLEDKNIPFSIPEISEYAGMNVCRIPDDVDPYSILNNRTYLSLLSDYSTIGLGFYDYSDEDETFTLTWNCTFKDYNSLTGNSSRGAYYLAPSGYYVMFRDPLHSSDDNDNQLRFNLNENSVFYLEGLTPSIVCDYDNTSSCLDLELSINSESFENGSMFDVHMAVYETNGSDEDITFNDQFNMSWNGQFSKNYSIPTSLNQQGDWIHVYVIINTSQGAYSLSWGTNYDYEIIRGGS